MADDETPRFAMARKRLLGLLVPLSLYCTIVLVALCMMSVMIGGFRDQALWLSLFAVFVVGCFVVCFVSLLIFSLLLAREDRVQAFLHMISLVLVWGWAIWKAWPGGLIEYFVLLAAPGRDSDPHDVIVIVGNAISIPLTAYFLHYVRRGQKPRDAAEPLG